MATKLQVEQGLNETAQSVTDEHGTTSPLALSTDAVGIGTEQPEDNLEVASRNATVRIKGTGTDHGGAVVKFQKSVTGAEREWWVGVGVESASDPGFTIWDHTERAPRLHIDPSGNVGIGTWQPSNRLDIVGPAPADANEGQLEISAPNGNCMLLGRADSYGFVQSHNKEPLALNPLGNNVGIGTTEPSEKLEVHGNILATGDVQLAGADCAEEFDVVEDAAVEPGTVMIVEEEDTLRPCGSAYDNRVAGVISGAGDYRPGIVLDRQPSLNKRTAIAISGKVYCKVDAQHGAIEVGDLLTTSPNPGYAMKADDPTRAFGAVIGKALKSLRSGTGLVPILVALQ